MSNDRRAFLRQLLIGGASVSALAACGGQGGSEGGEDLPDDPPKVNPEPDEPPVESGGVKGTESMSFIAIGDMGTGNIGQYHVAEAMRQIIEAQGCDFVLGAGDNIYEDGVTSVDDNGFLDSFEYPYQNLDVPFYMCLGNHDCASTIFGGGSDNQRGDYQVDYHYSDKRYSTKWRMPARFYKESFGKLAQEKPFLDLFVVDSNPLTSFYIDFDERFNWKNYGYPQQLWMKEAVNESEAHWKIAMSHVPYLSNGKHGNAGNLDEGMRVIFSNPDADGQRYKLFLEEAFSHKIDMLVTGHDHSLQWIKPVESMGPAHIIVSGAGGKSDKFQDPERNPTHYQAENELGFVWVHLTEERMLLEFYLVNEDTGEFRLGYSREETKPVQEVAAPTPA
ncbi:metallophosphoesterase [Marinobacter sp. S0848L]|uniref:metallophosphoesterase n=1 Tax=Marinobacter sp. S0848L TaxID=2926423 RepID=UPI001FF48DB4|nr:metallophosphoesterase [Marinobacter sp. S0848L]MCK0107465.1 metallophosphoesterase [Marinobacter sp. S0848L]